jgi:hypothetical protein
MQGSLVGAEQGLEVFFGAVRFDHGANPGPCQCGTVEGPIERGSEEHFRAATQGHAECGAETHAADAAEMAVDEKEVDRTSSQLLAAQHGGCSAGAVGFPGLDPEGPEAGLQSVGLARVLQEDQGAGTGKGSTPGGGAGPSHANPPHRPFPPTS